jgi:hypothetical protein
MATTAVATRLRLPPHFTVEEFDCHGGTGRGGAGDRLRAGFVHVDGGPRRDRQG